MFELGDYGHSVALVLQSKGTSTAKSQDARLTGVQFTCPWGTKTAKSGISCHVNSLIAQFLEMINVWILVALLLLSHSHSTITREQDETTDSSRNIDNSHSINLLRLYLGNTSLQQEKDAVPSRTDNISTDIRILQAETANSVAGVKLLKRNVKRFSDRSAETYRITKASRGLEG